MTGTFLRLRTATIVAAVPPASPPRPEPDAPDIVEVWGQDSFPASDPPANW